MAIPYQNFSPSYQALHVEHLTIQYEHLLFVRERHLQWMDEAQTPEIRELHRHLAELLEQTIAQYEVLIQELNR